MSAYIKDQIEEEVEMASHEGKQKGQYFIVEICSTCNKPVGILDLCVTLGYNAGWDGHGFDTKEEAEEAFSLLVEKLQENKRTREAEVLVRSSKVMMVTFE